MKRENSVEPCGRIRFLSGGHCGNSGMEIPRCSDRRNVAAGPGIGLEMARRLGVYRRAFLRTGSWRRLSINSNLFHGSVFWPRKLVESRIIQNDVRFAPEIRKGGFWKRFDCRPQNAPPVFSEPRETAWCMLSGVAKRKILVSRLARMGINGTCCSLKEQCLPSSIGRAVDS